MLEGLITIIAKLTERFMLSRSQALRSRVLSFTRGARERAAKRKAEREQK
jgi:hypothetical protein